MPRWVDRLSGLLRPHAFEAAVAANAMVLGLAGLYGRTHSTGILRLVLPVPLATVVDLAYVAAGLLIMLGLLRRRSNDELAGLFLLASSSLVRFVVAIYASALFGLEDHAGLLASHLFILLGCAGRIHSIVRGERVIVVTNGK